MIEVSLHSGDWQVPASEFARKPAIVGMPSVEFNDFPGTREVTHFVVWEDGAPALVREDWFIVPKGGSAIVHIDWEWL